MLRYRAYHKPWLLVLLTAILVVLAGAIQLVVDQRNLFFAVNSSHYSSLDIIMSIITMGGDGWVMIGLLLLMVVLREFLYILGTAFSSLLVLLTVQGLKNYVFTSFNRPWKVLQNMDIYLVPDYLPHSNHSFPSGHTATAFAVAFIVAAFAQKRWAQILAIVYAVLVAYSRIYLSQHWPIDVTAGAVLGITCSALGLWVADKVVQKIKK